VQAFVCAQCQQLLFFENSSCLRCGAALGFIPERMQVCALEELHDQTWKVSSTDGLRRFRRCERSEIATCNWMVPADTQERLCLACSLTQSAPPRLADAMARPFALAEMAKRRLIAQLLDLGLPFASRLDDPRTGLGFVLEGGNVVTGHVQGLITLNLAESDSVYREEVRLSFGEAYRTLLGHFRHEIGHYYWNRLIEHTQAHQRFRELFGDERQDYSAALSNHYASYSIPRWSDTHVSSYAASHPWEDWAETFAHYLHIRDVLQSAATFGVSVRGPKALGSEPASGLSSQPGRVNEARPFAEVLREWLPLTYALNALNRSMGKEDLYPFVLAPRVIEKLAFVHDLTSAARCS